MVLTPHSFPSFFPTKIIDKIRGEHKVGIDYHYSALLRSQTLCCRAKVNQNYSEFRESVYLTVLVTNIGKVRFSCGISFTFPIIG